MKKLAILVPAVALIFACSSNSSLQAGQWEFTTKMTDIELPGMPPEMAAQAKQAMGNQQQSFSRCMTEAEAANPGGSLANPGGNTQGCTFSKQTFAGGAIDVAGSCRAPTGGGTMETTLTGTYTATEINARITANVQGGPQALRMSGTMTGRRTGNCPG